MGGASLVTGLLGANASQNAAQTQANAATQASNNSLAATQASNALQLQMFNQGQANQSPYLQGGQEAYSALLGALGLGAPSAAGSTGSTGSTGAAGGTGGPNIYGGGINPGATLTSEGVPGQLQPAGSSATGSSPVAGTTNYGASQGQLNSANGSQFGALTGTFNNSDLNSQLAPNYAFQLGQGEQALQASMAATGQLQTGQGLKNINDYAQNTAAGAYQQAFNNYTTQKNNLFSYLTGAASPGSAAASGTQQAATATGSNVANTTMAGTAASNNYLTGGAAATAAGQVGVTNALGQALNGGIGNYFGGQVLQKSGVLGSTPSSGGGTGYFNPIQIPQASAPAFAVQD